MRLGARLAGAVKPEFQKKTVTIIAGQEVPEWFRVFLLGETKSLKAVDELMKIIKHPDSSIRSKSVWALRQLDSEAVMPIIFGAVEDSDSHVRTTAIRVIGELGSEQGVPLLLEILTKEPITSVREAAVGVLGKLDSEAAILPLLRATQDTAHNVSVMAVYYLEKMSREIVITALTKALKNVEVSICKSAANLPQTRPNLCRNLRRTYPGMDSRLSLPIQLIENRKQPTHRLHPSPGRTQRCLETRCTLASRCRAKSLTLL